MDKLNGRAGSFERPMSRIGPQPQPLLHPSWVEFVRFCMEMKHGEIENLKIQDGLPCLAEVVRRKVKFNE